MRWCTWMVGALVVAGCEGDGGQLGAIDPDRITIEQGVYGIGSAFYDGIAVPGPVRFEIFADGVLGGSTSADSDGFYELFKSPGTYTICTPEPSAICSGPVVVVELVPHRCDFVATETGGDWLCD